MHMKSLLLAAGAATTAVAFALPAQADTSYYVNPEFNQGFSQSQAGIGTLEMHVGAENDNGFYIQAGPALATGQGETVWGVTGKAGVSGMISPDASLYAEVSAGKFDGGDTGFGLKLGSKFSL